MDTKQTTLSRTRIFRLKTQGYLTQSDCEISELAFGNRFAFIVCGLIVAFGVASANITVLAVMALVAFGGVILPYHPLDYIYNHVLRTMINKPKLPPRSKQLKFTCIVATIWLIGTIYLFYTDFTVAGYIAGGLLFMVALIVSTTDFCIPSMIYNFLFKIKIEK
jgi:hypothetical protein